MVFVSVVGVGGGIPTILLLQLTIWEKTPYLLPVTPLHPPHPSAVDMTGAYCSFLSTQTATQSPGYGNTVNIRKQ